MEIVIVTNGLLKSIQFTPKLKVAIFAERRLHSVVRFLQGALTMEGFTKLFVLILIVVSYVP